MTRPSFGRWKIKEVCEEEDETDKTKATLVFFEDNDGEEQEQEFPFEDYDDLKALEGETVNVEYLPIDPTKPYGEKMFLNFVDKVPTTPKEVSISQIRAKQPVKVEFT